MSRAHNALSAVKYASNSGRGKCSIVGRKSDNSLYNLGLATYDSGDQFDHNAALGFIKLWGLPLSTQAQAQLLPSIGFEGNLLKQAETKK